jgi:fructose-bisphosphate aldolase class II
MPLATMGEIIGPARAAGRGVGAFNVIGIEHAEAIVAGAEAAGAPVVLQISENCAAWHGALEPIARACLAVARAAAVPVAVHLDHASGAKLVRAASAFGLGSVMYAPIRTRRLASSRPPGWTRWPSRWAARTPC